MMNKLEKICLAISCFSPLYVILAIKNGVAICKTISDYCSKKPTIAFNATMLAIWFGLMVLSFFALFAFKKKFLEAQKSTKERVMVVSADNITSDHYFTYFSVFVLTFFAVDPTNLLDIVILGLLMLLIVVVYVKNEMWFINPVLNLFGYKSFRIRYRKESFGESEGEIGEINVFSKDNLSKMAGEKALISFSHYDFSVCHKAK